MPASCRPWIAGVGMIGRVVDVRPVDERGDAGVDALERARPGCWRRRPRAGTAARSCRAPRRSSRRASRSGAQLRIAASHVCRCVSTKPGITTLARASITSASAREVLPHLRDRVALDQDVAARRCRPSCGSTVSTWPPRSKIRSAIVVPFLRRVDVRSVARRGGRPRRSDRPTGSRGPRARRPTAAGCAASSRGRSVRRGRRTAPRRRSTRPRRPSRTGAGSPRP